MERCQRWARKPSNRQSGCDGKLANGQRNYGSDQASEGHQQKCEGGGDDETFGALDIVGAGLADVEVEGNLACELELRGWITGTQLILKGVGELVELGDERFNGSVG